MAQDAAHRHLAAAMDYEAHKLADRQTAESFSELGFALIPMVAETLGGWGPGAQEVFRVIARDSAKALGLG